MTLFPSCSPCLRKPCDTSSDLPSFATSPARYWFNCIKFVAATIETERDDVGTRAHESVYDELEVGGITTAIRSGDRKV